MIVGWFPNARRYCAECDKNVVRYYYDLSKNVLEGECLCKDSKKGVEIINEYTTPGPIVAVYYDGSMKLVGEPNRSFESSDFERAIPLGRKLRDYARFCQYEGHYEFYDRKYSSMLQKNQEQKVIQPLVKIKDFSDLMCDFEKRLVLLEMRVNELSKK